MKNTEKEMKVIRKIVIEITDEEINVSKNVKSNLAFIKDMLMEPRMFDCQVSRPTAHCIGRAHTMLVKGNSNRVAKLLLKALETKVD